MIDFSLTEADARLVALAKEEATIAHRYARHYDLSEALIEPLELPEAKDRPDPLQVLGETVAQTSGAQIANVLLVLEFADPRMRRNQALGLGSKIVEADGSEEQKQRFRNKTLAIAITEPGAGSDPRSVRTSARLDPKTNEWILNGEKIYCSYFEGADGVLVIARGSEEGEKFLAFVIEKGTPGLVDARQVRKMGIRAWDTKDFFLRDCRVPEANRIDVDFKRTMASFNGNRPRIAAMALAISWDLIEFTRAQLAGTGSDAAPLSAEIEYRLARLEALHEAARLTVLRSKWTEQRDGTASASTMVEAAMSKAIGGAAARQISQECMAMLGHLAVSEEFLAEKWFRDARIFDIFEGTGEINRLIVARAVLGYSARELG